RLRSNERQPSGRSNNWAAVIGGPVRIPKLYNGRDKLFFFFSYNAFKDVKSEEGTAVNQTVPAEAQRRGDFSELLKVDPVRYQIYDPRTARMEGNRVVRSPFPNNQVPILNPLYNAYVKLYPLPNNVPGVVGADGSNNWLASATPFNWDYKAYSNRIDYQISPRHRMFGKWSWNDFLEDRHDWTYPTVRGLQSNGLSRLNVGITVDYVFIMNPTTTWNFSVAWNRFRSGDTVNEVQKSFSPGSVGLPGYVDQKAGDFKLLPRLDFSDSSY